MSLFSSLTTYISTRYRNIVKDDSDRSLGMLTFSRWTATLSALIVAIILARIIDNALYGQYTKLWMLYVLFGQVVISAFGTVALQRLANAGHVYQTLVVQRNISFLLGLLSFSILFVLAPFLANFLKSQEMASSIKLFSVFVGISVFCSPMEALFIHQNRKKNYLLFSVGYHICTAFVVIIGFWLSNDLLQTVKWMLVMPIAKAFYMISAYLRERNVNMVDKAKGNFFVLKDEWHVSLGLGLVLFFNALLSIASHDLDRWIVASWFNNDAAFAVYAIGAKKIPFIAALTSSISAALVAHHSFVKNEFSKAAFQAKLQYYMNKLFVPIVIIILFTQLHAEELIQLLYGSKYLAAATYFRWYQWALLGDILFGLTAFLIANNKRQILLIALAEFSFNLVLSIILLQYYGPNGVIAATVFSHIVFSALAILYGVKLFKLDWKAYFPNTNQWQNFVITVVVLLSSYFLGSSYFELNNWFLFVIMAVLCISFGLHFFFQKSLLDE